MMYVEIKILFPIIISIITVLSVTTTVTSKPAPTRLIVTRVGPCSDSNDLKIEITEMAVERNEAYNFYINGWLFIKGNVSNDWDVKVIMEKCLDIRNLDTCDTFRSFPFITGGCSTNGIIGDEIDLYATFFYTTPKYLACPIQAGTYKVSYPFYAEDNHVMVPEAKISTSIFGYKARFAGIEGEKTVMCIEAYLQLMYIRKHKWIDAKKQATEEKHTAKRTKVDTKKIVKNY